MPQILQNAFKSKSRPSPLPPLQQKGSCSVLVAVDLLSLRTPIRRSASQDPTQFCSDFKIWTIDLCKFFPYDLQDSLSKQRSYYRFCRVSFSACYDCALRFSILDLIEHNYNKIALSHVKWPCKGTKYRDPSIVFYMQYCSRLNLDADIDWPEILLRNTWFGAEDPRCSHLGELILNDCEICSTKYGFLACGGSGFWDIRFAGPPICGASRLRGPQIAWLVALRPG